MSYDDFVIQALVEQVRQLYRSLFLSVGGASAAATSLYLPYSIYSVFA